MFHWSSSSSSSLESESNCCFPIPKDYQFVRVLGRGTYGTVVACVKEESEEVMAIKVFPQKFSRNAQWEARIMENLMQYNLEMSNIIKYLGTYSENETTCLMYEMLDISLEDYLNILGGPMRLEHVRIVIQQMAVAFRALKSVGAIHADLKIDNIMMVDHMRQPFKLKLIDFGLTVFRWHAKPGETVQTIDNRAPEILLGLPFSEAIDIWSLGSVMAAMVFFVQLFPVSNEYNALRFITELLGPPPQHLLRIGKKTRLFYKKTDDQWQLKTPEEYLQEWGKENGSADNHRHDIHSLDEMKTVRLEKDNPREADERRECIELLKAMLQWDERDRITPSGILNHPFITQSYLNSTSNLSGPSSNEPEASSSQMQVAVGTQTENRISKALPPGVILVQSADPENRIHLGDEPSEDSNLSTYEALPPSVISVQPADPENRIHLGDEPSEDSNLSTHEALPPSVISVQPADPENRIHLGDEPSEDSNLSTHEALPPSVISVQSADPENTPHEDTGQSSHTTPYPASTVYTTSNLVDTDPPTLDDSKVPKKKKKNCFRRFFSWVKRTFSCKVDTVE